jgi:hypothetical protein
MLRGELPSPAEIRYRYEMDYCAIAGQRDLAAFRQEFPCFFLIGDASLHRPQRAMATISLDPASLQSLSQAPPEPEAGASHLIFPVKKVQATLPSMISVGRTANNDIVINDVQISKFHALFRVRGNDLEIEDAGSVNGTRVGTVQIAKGQPKVVRNGDRIGFGTVELKLFDTEAAWHALRSMR